MAYGAQMASTLPGFCTNIAVVMGVFRVWRCPHAIVMGHPETSYYETDTWLMEPPTEQDYRKGKTVTASYRGYGTNFWGKDNLGEVPGAQCCYWRATGKPSRLVADVLIIGSVEEAGHAQTIEESC